MCVCVTKLARGKEQLHHPRHKTTSPPPPPPPAMLIGNESYCVLLCLIMETVHNRFPGRRKILSKRGFFFFSFCSRVFLRWDQWGGGSKMRLLLLVFFLCFPSLKDDDSLGRARVCVWILNMWKVLCANVCLTLECKQTVFLRAKVKTKKNRKDWKARWDVLLLTEETHRPGHEGVGAIVFTQSEGVQYWEWIWKVLNYWSFFPTAAAQPFSSSSLFLAKQTRTIGFHLRKKEG